MLHWKTLLVQGFYEVFSPGLWSTTQQKLSGEYLSSVYVMQKRKWSYFCSLSVIINYSSGSSHINISAVISSSLPGWASTFLCAWKWSVNKHQIKSTFPFVGLQAVFKCSGCWGKLHNQYIQPMFVRWWGMGVREMCVFARETKSFLGAQPPAHLQGSQGFCYTVCARQVWGEEMKTWCNIGLGLSSPLIQ